MQTTVAERKRIFALIDEAFAKNKKPTKIELSPVLELKLGAITENVESMLKRFETWKKRRVVVDPEVMAGEAVFSGSRLTVRHIGSMMLRGRSDTLQEIREDYPRLSPEDIEFAKLYTVAYPKVGRPRAREAATR